MYELNKTTMISKTNAISETTTINKTTTKPLHFDLVEAIMLL